MEPKEYGHRPEAYSPSLDPDLLTDAALEQASQGVPDDGASRIVLESGAEYEPEEATYLAVWTQVRDDRRFLQDSGTRTERRQMPGHPQGEEYEGTVRIVLESSGGISQVIHFMRDLHRQPEIRVLKLVSCQEDGVDLLVALRQPLNLMHILPNMAGESRVGAILVS